MVPESIGTAGVTDCWAELGLADQLQCEFCGAGIRAVNPLGGGCPLCLSADLRFDQAVCLGIIWIATARRGDQDEKPTRRSHGRSVGTAADRARFQPSFFQSVDFVVPVPTYWGRRLMRGLARRRFWPSP